MENSATTCDSLLFSAWSDLRSGDLQAAYEKLSDCLRISFDRPEVLTGLKYSNFWRERQKNATEFLDPYTKIEYLIQQWPIFLEFQHRNPIDNEECNFAFRYYVFGLILSILDQVTEKNDVQDPGILLRKGICLKGMGNYDDALRIIEQASTYQTDNSDILAQLADCYALVGEANLSKVFFREAFFIEPQDISCDFLESEMIQRLFDVVREKVGKSTLIPDWIPVYGDIYRVFSIKRELRAVEYGKLRQSVYSLEREYANQPEKREAIMPRLLNKYFWIVDHLVSIREDKGRIQEVLLKIRSINPEIFTLYTK